MKTFIIGYLCVAVVLFQSCAPETPQKDHDWVYTNYQIAKNIQPAYKCLDQGDKCVLGSTHPLPVGTTPGQWRTGADSLFGKLKALELTNNLASYFSDTTEWQRLIPPSVVGYSLIDDVKLNRIKVGIGADSSIYFFKGNSGFVRDSIVLIWKWNE